MDKLMYGLKNNELIHIDHVEKGLACNCQCPHCHGRLIARKGEKNAKHFAHYQIADCNHGTETALHLMAKQIVAQTCRVFVPYVPKTVYDFSNRGKVFTFDNAVLEKQLSDKLRGDVVLYLGNSILNVEIKVTHEIDLNKTIELFNLGIPTIEIDFSDIQSNFTPEIIKQRILSGEYTNLINSPKDKKIFAQRILGEWKKVSNSRFVCDCPLSRKKAYFVDYNNKGGFAECHDCYSSYSIYDGGEHLLCFGRLGDVDFNEVDKILDLVKENNHVISVELLMNDGNVMAK